VELSEDSLPRRKGQSARPSTSVDEKGLASLSPEAHFTAPENRAKCGLPLGLVVVQNTGLVVTVTCLQPVSTGV